MVKAKLFYFIPVADVTLPKVPERGDTFVIYEDGKQKSLSVYSVEYIIAEDGNFEGINVHLGSDYYDYYD